MFKRVKKFFGTIFFACLSIFSSTAAANTLGGEKILFIPHDDRPISCHQTVEVVEQVGYELLLPPKKFLNGAETSGQPDELWQWLEENAPAAKSAVVSADALLYGGLIPSRKHEISREKISERLKKFQILREKNPSLKLYVFASLMRTPIYGTAGDIEEPEYYAQHGGNIFQYTRLLDKQETSQLNKNEKNFLTELKKNIPQEIFEDWFDRREKNLSATKKLCEFTRAEVIDYLLVGRDDSSALSQTHRENRELLAWASEKNLLATKFQSLTGIDEFNLLLLTRAVNELRHEIPFVHVQYNRGKGGKTIPAYSDEPIENFVNSAMTLAGGITVPNPKRADLVLLINTDPKGKTFHTHNPYPDGKIFKPILKPNSGTKFFAGLVEKNISEGFPVGVADITFGNGADNALMKILREKNLLFKLQIYSGWNTATNSTGFAIGAGILSRHMTDSSREKILARRYLDDWAYQANVRTVVGNELVKNFGNPEFYFRLGDKLSFAEEKNSLLMQEFAQKNLPPLKILREFKVTNPWHRMFECDIKFTENSSA